MGKKNRPMGIAVPQLTKAKMIRLLVFAILTTAGFLLNAYVPEVRNFGWGYAFGMAAMAALTG